MFKTIQSTSLTITQIEKISYLKADGSKYASPLPFFLKQEFDLAKNVDLKTNTLEAIKIKWAKKL